MDIQDLNKMKKESGLTNNEIAELSGVPVSTVNKIFSGATKNPRYATLLAIEQVLATGERLPFTYDCLREEPNMVRESAAPYRYSARNYSGDDIEKLSEAIRAELILGNLYMMAAPSRMHQFLVTELLFRIKGLIREHKGNCRVYTAPFDVRLFGDDSVIVQPDITLVCNEKFLTDQGCCGAPDWVIEIVSAGNFDHDYITKMMQYQKAGVREYWIVNPFERNISVYNFEDRQYTGQYTYSDKVPSTVLEGLEVRVDDFVDEF